MKLKEKYQKIYNECFEKALRISDSNNDVSHDVMLLFLQRVMPEVLSDKA